MDNRNISSVQNRFTSYLITAVMNKKISYMNRVKRRAEKEFVQTDLVDKNYQDFEVQYYNYIGERMEFIFKDWERIEELLLLLETEKLVKVLKKIKERERKILFARVYGELTFKELGEKFHMEPRQAEMSYYYVLRKLRKELEAR